MVQGSISTKNSRRRGCFRFSFDGRACRDGLILWRAWEVGSLESCLLTRKPRRAHQLLSLLGVLSGVLLHCLRGAASVLSRKVFHLVGLLVDDVAGIVDVVVNELLVLDVDKWSKEDDTVRNQGKAPQRHPLDEPVADERGNAGLQIVRYPHIICREGCTYTNSNPDVLREEDSLKLDNEEIEQLTEIVCEALEGVLRDYEVLPRPNPRRQTAAESSMSDNLC